MVSANRKSAPTRREIRQPPTKEAKQAFSYRTGREAWYLSVSTEQNQNQSTSRSRFSPFTCVLCSKEHQNGVSDVSANLPNLSTSSRSHMTLQPSTDFLNIIIPRS